MDLFTAVSVVGITVIIQTNHIKQSISSHQSYTLTDLLTGSWDYTSKPTRWSEVLSIKFFINNDYSSSNNFT